MLGINIDFTEIRKNGEEIEMEIKAQEISRILKEQIQDYDAGVELAEVGSVLSVGDGIARIHGLEGVAAGELLEFPGEVMAIALNLSLIHI